MSIEHQFFIFNCFELTFLMMYALSNLHAWIRWSGFISKSVWLSFSWRDYRLHIQLVCKFKIRSFAQFSVDQLPQPVVPDLVLLLCQCAKFTWVFDCLVPPSLSVCLSVCLSLSLFEHNLNLLFCPVGWGSRILWLLLCRGVRLFKWAYWVWH